MLHTFDSSHASFQVPAVDTECKYDDNSHCAILFSPSRETKFAGASQLDGEVRIGSVQRANAKCFGYTRNRTRRNSVSDSKILVRGIDTAKLWRGVAVHMGCLHVGCE